MCVQQVNNRTSGEKIRRCTQSFSGRSEMAWVCFHFPGSNMKRLLHWGRRDGYKLMAPRPHRRVALGERSGIYLATQPKERRWCNAPFRIDVENRPECKCLFGTKLVWTTRTLWSCEVLNTVALKFLRHTLNRLAPTPLTTAAAATAATVGQLQHWSPLDGLSRATNLY